MTRGKVVVLVGVAATLVALLALVAVLLWRPTDAPGFTRAEIEKRWPPDYSSDRPYKTTVEQLMRHPLADRMIYYKEAGLQLKTSGESKEGGPFHFLVRELARQGDLRVLESLEAWLPRSHGPLPQKAGAENRPTKAGFGPPGRRLAVPARTWLLEWERKRIIWTDLSVWTRRELKVRPGSERGRKAKELLTVWAIKYPHSPFLNRYHPDGLALLLKKFENEALPGELRAQSAQMIVAVGDATVIPRLQRYASDPTPVITICAPGPQTLGDIVGACIERLKLKEDEENLGRMEEP